MVPNVEGTGHGTLVILRPHDRPLSLAVGKTIQAQVIDTFPPDGLTLRLDGAFIPARTSVPLEKGATVLLKVMNFDDKTRQAALQLVSPFSEKHAALSQQTQRPEDPRFQRIGSLLDELSQLLARGPSRGITGLSDRGNAGMGGAQDRHEAGTLRGLVAELLKSLPSEAPSLPGDVRTRLQDVLLQSLGATGRNIHSRMEALVKCLPGELRSEALDGTVRPGPTFPSETFEIADLRNAIKDTGVLLEAKLRDIALRTADPACALRRTEGGTEGEPPGPPSTPQKDPVSTEDARRPMDASELRGDLKARLLRLREALTGDWQSSPLKTLLRTLSSSLGMEPSESTDSHRGTVRMIDGILCDIETYQLLSKATESLHTFLPLAWDNLRDGEISFRRKQRGSPKGVYSCRLSLDLEGLGMLSAMIVMQNDSFTVSFRADRPELREALSLTVPDLEEAFARKGLSLNSTTVVGADDRFFDQLDVLWSVEAGLSMKA